MPDDYYEGTLEDNERVEKEKTHIGMQKRKW